MILSNFFDNEIFHFKHIMILVVCITAIVLFTIYAIKKPLKRETFHKILLAVGIISESLKVISYVMHDEATLFGYLSKDNLPFHLCSIQLIFILVLNLSKNEKLKHLLYSFMVPTCMIGGGAALFIATWSSLNMWVVTIQYFLYHSTIVSFAIYLLATEKFNLKDVRNCLIMLVATLFIAIYLNAILAIPYYSLVENTEGVVELQQTGYGGVNFMYVINPPKDGLPFLNRKQALLGSTWLAYLLKYAAVAIVAVCLVYIKPFINFFKTFSKKEAK